MRVRKLICEVLTPGCRVETGVGEDHPMDRRQVAQAVEFIRALRVQLGEMTSQLGWIERQNVRASNARASALRIEAATLRRDIKEAQSLIDRLERHYLERHAADRVPRAARRPAPRQEFNCGQMREKTPDSQKR